MESSTGQRWDIFSIKKNNDYNVLKAGKYRKLKVHNDLKKKKKTPYWSLLEVVWVPTQHSEN